MEKFNKILVLGKTKYGTETTFLFQPGEDIELSGYMTREGYYFISKPLPVDFEPLPSETIIESQVSAIEKLINEEEGRHYAKIAELVEQKKRLLAITHQEDL